MRLTLQQSATALAQGSVLAIPTETVYGLAARIDRPRAVDQIYTLKKRPRANPLIVHAANFEQICPFIRADFPYFEVLKSLGEAFWPGPLTLILPICQKSLSRVICAGLLTAGFRVPSHPLAQKLLLATGPLAAPSANLSGSPSATRAEHVESDFGPELAILDGGPCDRGIESTILGWQSGQLILLRAGAITAGAVQRALKNWGVEVRACRPSQPTPGSYLRHYAPRAELTFDLAALKTPIVVLGFEDRQYPNCPCLINLGSSRRPAEVSRRLYAALRELDDRGVRRAFVDLDFPDEGLWASLKERLLRAGDQGAIRASCAS